MDIVDCWLTRYDWHKELPHAWKLATHRLVVELTAERFVGLGALHEALAGQDLDAVWNALEDQPVSDRCVDFIDALVNRGK